MSNVLQVLEEFRELKDNRSSWSKRDFYPICRPCQSCLTWSHNNVLLYIFHPNSSLRRNLLDKIFKSSL